jgi:HlyD family secretion protein
MPENQLEPIRSEKHTRSIVAETDGRGPIVGSRKHVRRAGGRRQALLALFALVVIGGVIAAAYYWFIPRDDVYVLADYDIATVAVVTLQDTVEVSGTVNARQWATVGAPEAGEIDRLYVEEGDWVWEDQLVAQLDAEDVQDDLLAKERDLERQLRELDRFLLQHEYTLRSYDRQRQNLLDSIDDAEEEATEVQELFDLGAASQGELDDADDRVEETRDALEDHDADVEEYQALHELNTANYEDDIAELEEEIAELEERISDTVVFAPISGRVISVSDAATTDGEILSQNEEILQLADTRNPLVETEIEEQYVGFITEGQPVAVEISSSRIPGGVERVGLTAQTTTSGGTPTVELDVALDVGEAEILPGSSALVEILIGEIADAVVLPRGPYLTSGNRRYLYRIDGETATRIDVEYGEITDEYVQVVSGVQPGDRIITSSYQNYIDHQTIELGEDR